MQRDVDRRAGGLPRAARVSAVLDAVHDGVAHQLHGHLLQRLVVAVRPVR